MLKINIILGVVGLIFVGAANADVCVHLSSNTLGNQAVYEVTGLQGYVGVKQETLVSPPLKNQQEHFFLFKNIQNLGALKVKVSMITPDGELILTCTNALIRPLAKSALLTITQDTWDAGQCLMSTTPFTDVQSCR